MSARAMVFDAAGTKVSVDDDWNGKQAIVIGDYLHVIHSAEEAQALIDAIWKAGRTTRWTLTKPEGCP